MDIIKTIEGISEVEIEFYFKENDKYIGKALRDIDGYYYFQFENHELNGMFSENQLISIGEKLKDLNKEWNEVVKNMNDTEMEDINFKF